MKIKTENKKFPNLWQGLAGVILFVSAFVLPVTGYSEEAVNKTEAPQKYVMPREQVYLDPSQVEAAKQQIEADAKYNSEPQNNAAVSAGNNETLEAKPAENTEPVLEEKKAETVKPSEETGQEKYVMPQEQVYLDPSQIEAAKQQKAEDARINAQPRAKNVEVVTGDRVIADVKVVEPEKPAAAEAKEVKQTETPQQQETVKDKTETRNTAAENKTQAETKPGAAVAENKTDNKTAAPEEQPVSQQKPVRLHHFGLSKEVTTRHATVGEVLEEMKINLDGRKVYPPADTKITDGMVIHVLARKSFLSQEEAEVPFGTQIINDPEMAFGEKKVEKEGVKGKDLVIYENITRPGREQKIELDRRRIAEPVNEILRQGVAQSILTPDGYVRYKKKIYGEATAYTWGGGASGHTSIGLWPRRGIVAVDPRVIPYHTKLYIPGYGMAIAGDTGGAIVGTRIDLFMDSLYECFQWGRRDVEIYILE